MLLKMMLKSQKKSFSCPLKVFYVQGANEIETRVKVGNNRKEVLNQLYNITGNTFGNLKRTF